MATTSSENTKPPPQDDGPEPGNARYPSAAPGQQGSQGPGGQPGQQAVAGAEGQGRRRFRRQRRGGRGRGKGKGGAVNGQAAGPGYTPPLDAQGRIFDIENEQNQPDDEDGDEGEAEAPANGTAGGTPAALVAALPAANLPPPGADAGAPPGVDSGAAPDGSSSAPPAKSTPPAGGGQREHGGRHGRSRAGRAEALAQAQALAAAQAAGAAGEPVTGAAQGRLPFEGSPAPRSATGAEPKEQAPAPGAPDTAPSTPLQPAPPTGAAATGGSAAPGSDGGAHRGSTPASAPALESAGAPAANGNLPAPSDVGPAAQANGNVSLAPVGPQPAPANGNGQQGPQAHGHGGQQHGRQHNQQQPHGRQQHQQQRHPQQQRQPEPMTPVDGFLDVDHRGNGRLRQQKANFLAQPDDPDVPRHIIDRDKLRPGVHLVGHALKRNGRLQVTKVDTVEGMPPQQAAQLILFQNLTVIDPDDRLVMETTSKETLTRIIDIVAPIGLGQRALIVAPPKTGKTIMLQKISYAVTTNRPDVIQMVLLVDERPEEVTDFRRTVKAEVYASSSDRPTDEHLQVSEMVLERAKRLVELGKDVVILLDSITRLSRAYNKEVESSGRTLSGGVDSRALERPKRLFGAARNAEEGGSLTIIATALIDTGSRMDEVIFEEFKGTGNLEINLDRQLAEKRVFPAINIQTSGTRKEEKLFSQHEYEKVKKLRGALFSLKPTESMERLIKSVNEYKSNAEFIDAI